MAESVYLKQGRRRAVGLSVYQISNAFKISILADSLRSFSFFIFLSLKSLLLLD